MKEYFNKFPTTLATCFAFKYLKKVTTKDNFSLSNKPFIIPFVYEINCLTYFKSKESKNPKLPKATKKICTSIIFGLLLGCFKISTNLSLCVKVLL